MAKTVVGLFDNPRDAQSVVEDLVNAGFMRSDVSLIGQAERGDAESATAEDTTSGTAVGLGTGAVLGGIGGLLVGLGVLAIPGIGPVLAAGPLATALAGAGLGAAAGGALGALTDLGIPESEAHYYAEGVRRGGTLVTVKVDDALADRAAEIMERHHPIDIEERAATWRETGWTGWSATARPYTTEDVRRERDLYATRHAQQHQITEAPAEGARPARPRVGEPVAEQGVYGGMRNRAGRGVRAYTPTAGKAGPSAFGSFDDGDYRSHYDSALAQGGQTYEQCVVAYRFGYDLEQNQRYRSIDWQTMEPEARRQWEERHPGTWDPFKAAIRYAWERARGRRAA